MRYVRTDFFRCDGSPSPSRYLRADFSLISAILAESSSVLPNRSSRRSSFTRPSLTIATSLKIKSYDDLESHPNNGIP